MATYLITGTSRGMGLELVKQLLDLPESQVGQIFAVTRNKSTSLQILIDRFPERVRNVLIDDFKKDTTVHRAIAEIESVLQGQGLDVLFNVAGTNQPFTPDGLKSLTSCQLLNTFNTNV